MEISYGPPGIGGVKSLQYVSGVDGTGCEGCTSPGWVRELDEVFYYLVKPAAVVATAAASYGLAFGNKKLANRAGVVALIAWMLEAAK